MRVKEELITTDFLDQNPDVIFVFGDNLIRQGKGGAALLRDHPQAWGFITKLHPASRDEAFYTSYNYNKKFRLEMEKLHRLIRRNPDKRIFISRVGAGLANRFGIWEEIIEPKLEFQTKCYNNVYLLWD